VVVDGKSSGSWPSIWLNGYSYAKVYGGLERRGIDPLIPAKAEPIKSRVPTRRFR
jgi:hypothetical protein